MTTRRSFRYGSRMVLLAMVIAAVATSCASEPTASDISHRYFPMTANQLP